MIIPKGESLVTYYMLPLVGVNKLTFGRSFKASYIDEKGLKIYVELSKNMHNPTYKRTENYVSEILNEGTLFVVFNIPAEFQKDAAFFIFGEYSQMSTKAKKRIYLTSSLPYNASMGSFKVSHPILQALDRTKTLRTFLLEEIGLTSLPETSELIDKPSEDWFIEHRFKN